MTKATCRTCNQYNFIFILIQANSPTLKYNSSIPPTNVVIPEEKANISCELYTAGPPLPVLLTLEVLEGNVTSIFTNVCINDPETCTWSYLNPLEWEIPESIKEQVRYHHHSGFCIILSMISISVLIRM